MRKIARAVGHIVTTIYEEQGIGTGAAIQSALSAYAEAILPWASRVAGRMLGDIRDKSKDAYRSLGNEISFELRRELDHAHTGFVFQDLMAGQVQLIQSIPRDAAIRVHDLVREGLIGGKRPKEVSEAILASGDVAKSRAILIARTETSRAATSFVQARAQYAGSTHFIWHSLRDRDVRERHRLLDGTTHRWDEPPECDPGKHALPGCIYNCRCWAEPVLPDITI